MGRARRHQRSLSVVAFGLLALVAELAGRGLTQQIDLGRHLSRPSYADADYYPFLLGAVKVGVALLLACLACRFVKARATARAGRRLLAALGSRPARRAPRPRLVISPRLWLAFFGVTSLIYLVQTEAEQVWAGGSASLAPWLHTPALPVFAVLAVFAALVWSAVARWLADYESYAQATVAHARRLASLTSPPASYAARTDGLTPRRLFGLAFESRPPPAPA